MCMHSQMHVYLREVHLRSPPQDESLRGEDVCDYTEHHEEDGHRHHYHIMANACANVQPAAVVLHQEEKVQSHQVGDNQDNEE